MRWKTFMLRSSLWLTAEVWLNLLGIDSFADYSEFIFERDLELQKKNNKTIRVVKTLPQFCQKIKNSCPAIGAVIKIANPQESLIYQNPIFKHKCTKLSNPCIRALYLSNLKKPFKLR